MIVMSSTRRQFWSKITQILHFVPTVSIRTIVKITYIEKFILIVYKSNLSASHNYDSIKVIHSIMGTGALAFSIVLYGL